MHLQFRDTLTDREAQMRYPCVHTQGVRVKQIKKVEQNTDFEGQDIYGGKVRKTKQERKKTHTKAEDIDVRVQGIDARWGKKQQTQGTLANLAHSEVKNKP